MKDLRQQADESLDKKTGESTTGNNQAHPTAEIQTMLHELQIQKVELELQNEELRRLQAELVAANSRYIDLYDNAPVGYLTISKAGLIETANQAAGSLIGLPRDAIINRRMHDFLDASSQDDFFRLFQGVFTPSNRLPKEGMHSNGAGAFEINLRRPDGTLVEAGANYSTTYAENGEPLLRLILKDIGERRAAEAQLHFQGQLLDTIGQAVICTDSTGRITFFNRAAEELYGWAKHETVGVHILEITVPQTSQDQAREIMDQLAAGRPWSGEFMVQRRDKSLFFVQVINMPMSDATGKPSGILGVSYDITERREAQNAKRIADQMLEKAFSASPVGMALVDIEGKFIRGNDALCRIVGLKEQELKDIDFATITHPEDVVRDVQALREMLEGRRDKYYTEKQYRHKDGHWVPVQLSVSVVRSDNGAPVQFISIMQDITDRKRVESAARLQSQLLNAIGQSVIGTDVQGKVTFLNRAAEELYGWSAKEAIGMHIVDLNVPKTSVEEANAILAALAEQGTWSGEFEVTRRDGTTFHAQVNNSLVTDHSGKVIGMLGVSSDISERKLAETKLRHTTEVLERTGALAKIGGWQVDLQTMKLSWSSETFRIAERENPVEPPLEDGINLFAPEARETIAAAVQAAMQEGKPYDLELPIITEKGNLKWVQTQGFAEEKDGKVVRIYGTFQDITERRRVETERASLEAQLRLSQKLQALGTLAGGIAHDFNNIIANILGNAGLASEDAGQNSPAQSSLHEITKSATRARALVQQILAFSRQQPVQRATMPIAPVIDEVARTLRSRLPVNVHIAVEIADASICATVNTAQIEQVVTNLAINAIQALATKGGRVIIGLDSIARDTHEVAGNPRLKLLPECNRIVRLSVSDDGPGIEADKLERIFEPFFTTKPTNEGTGLGLSVVHGIVESHEGVLIVESTPGILTRFTVYFPQSEIRATAAESQTAPAQTFSDGRHVLILDDEESMVMLAKSYLQRRGYRVSGFTRFQEAISAIKAETEKFDVIVTDYNMPGTSGIQFTRDVKAIRSESQVILLSGYFDEALIAEAKAAGIAKVIAKADGMDVFCNAIDELIAQRA